MASRDPEKTKYSLLQETATGNLDEVSLHDETTTSFHLQNEIRLWRRRFNVLLISSLTSMVLLIAGAVYTVLTLEKLSCSCQNSGTGAIMMPPGVKLPYCMFSYLL